MAKSKKKLLLALDGSNQAFEAVRYVSRLIPSNRMDVVLFNVLTKFPESFWDIEKEPEYFDESAGTRSWEAQQNQEIRTFMEKARQSFLDQNVSQNAVHIKIQERKMGIARDILHESQNNYDGVVVGRWGTSMLKDFLWGSITSKLIGRLTHTPVCIVGGTPQIGKILVALDTSEGAKRVIDYLGAMVDSTSWEVTLFHAIRDFNRAELQKAEKAMASIFKESTDYLEKAGFNQNQINTKVVTKVPSRSSAIIAEAYKGRYGTIVVGRRGLSNVEDFYMGRVSNKIVQMARKLAVWVVT